MDIGIDKAEHIAVVGYEARKAYLLKVLLQMLMGGTCLFTFLSIWLERPLLSTLFNLVFAIIFTIIFYFPGEITFSKYCHVLSILYISDSKMGGPRLLLSLSQNRNLISQLAISKLFPYDFLRFPYYFLTLSHVSFPISHYSSLFLTISHYLDYCRLP